MGIDVYNEIEIAAPRSRVAAFVFDSNNDIKWISGIQEAKVLTIGRFGVGSLIARKARFLGRDIRYVNEVTRLEPNTLLEMRSVEGPFPMKITYSFEDRQHGTLAKIRVEGNAGGFYALAAPFLEGAVKKSVAKDLENLKRLMEQSKTFIIHHA